MSKKSEHFLPLIEGVRAEIVPARLVNNAGIVGAAMAADAARVGVADAAQDGAADAARVGAADARTS